ncbi:DUF4864 domain-containing protein [Yoonia sp.]|uniref:DUF4864 domain-containing protein n=1 Tax=Yoonia sp. TaxID=2212373 RepID=UPI003F6BD87C
MGRIFAVVFGLFLTVMPAVAQDTQAIEDVIGSQLEAFSDRDVAQAWTYASPNIQRLFGDPGNFGMMVQRGYPMVWDNSEVRYLELREIAGNLWQKVMIRDANGGLHMLDYQMVETERGWQINGVQLLPPPDVGA